MMPEIFFRAATMSETERQEFVDTGAFNEIIRGYLVCAMGYADFAPKDVKRALGGLHIALDEFTAAEAQQMYRNFAG